MGPSVAGYDILVELGRGGMGVVYRARQRSLQRLVALKLIRDGALAGPQERARFRIEAEAAARMQHPHIVALYEVGEDAGRPFFAMELVEGGSLAQYLAGRPQPAPQAAELIRTLARAVQHAHVQHIVHRDLKPANVLLQVADGKPPMAMPKIADFGLAKRLDTDSTAWTQEGAVLGTASYMAPEQAAGRVQEVGPAVDVYALGAILYELLTGRPPFVGDTWNQTLEQVLHEEPVPPSRRQADVPRDLETICLKCLEKEPARRYGSAVALAEDLGRFLDGLTVAAVPLDARERLARQTARDGYQLGDVIGRGPCSTVYRARYEALGQNVALKVFAAGTCTREGWESQLRRSAEQWVGLAHPQLVPVQRAGWWDENPYLAREYVPHGSLADRIAQQAGSVRGKEWLATALRLLEQLAEIVSYLHRQGVVHGNLKPSNVLLAAGDLPRLVDFRPTGGLFLRPAADAAEPAGLGYLAPEAVRDRTAEPRFYTDIYGLGIILYELLTGRPPFAEATDQAVGERVQSQDPVPPTQVNAGVPPPLEAICLRCLGKNPWRRFERAHDLLNRLRAVRGTLDGRTGANASPRRPPSGA